MFVCFTLALVVCVYVLAVRRIWQHLSTDNLSFVAGLRGRPIPAPVGRPKVRRRPKAEAPKDDDDDQVKLKAEKYRTRSTVL